MNSEFKQSDIEVPETINTKPEFENKLKSINSLNNQLIQKKKNKLNLKTFPFKIVDNDEYVTQLQRYVSLKSRIKTIDFINALLNLITIGVFYFDHFEYVGRNSLSLTYNNEIIRSVFLLTSVIMCFLIYMSHSYRDTCKLIKLEVGAKNNRFDYELKKPYIKFYLVVEIILHLLQPYPFVQANKNFVLIGKDKKYNINMIFFFLCSLRVYVLFKILGYLNLYSQRQSKEVLRFFDKQSTPNIFLYRSNLKQNGFITLAMIGALTLLYFSLMFQVFENTSNMPSDKYYYLWNCLWYLVVTMCTIGYGDYTPETLIGRLIGIICCIIGIFILSVLVVTLSLYVNLEEDELMAYNEIVSLGDTHEKKIKMENYMTQYILCKYKFIRKKVDLQTILKRRKIDFEKRQIFIDLKKKYTNKYNLTEFNKNCMKLLDEKTEQLYAKLDNLIDMQDTAEKFINLQNEVLAESKKTKDTIFAIVNMAKIIDCIGGIKKINDLNLIEHKKIYEDEVFEKSKENLLKQINANKNNQFLE